MPGKMVKVSALEALFMMVKVGRRPETLPWDYGSAKQVEKECRSLVLGLDWEDSASSALRTQVGVYLQGRSVFGSTISRSRDKG